MRNSVRNLLLGALPAAGFAFALASSAPAGAQFFDIFAPPPPQFSDMEQARPRASHRRAHRTHHREAKHRRRKQEEDWNPKSAKGPFQIVVAIAQQEVLLFGQDGLVGRAPISTGMPEHPTPTGVFSVLSKARWHASNIYSGAPMPWMQRITWSGVAMHEGPRPGYPASHGCIRLPGDFAVRLFKTTKVGARVIVTRQAVAPVPIASPKLFVPAPQKDAAETQDRPVAVADASAAGTHMSFAAKSTATKSSGAAKAAGADAAASDAKPAGDAARPATTGVIALPEPAAPAKQKPAASDEPKPSGPVTVFVSRKQSKVFVRQGFVELFDMPATIAEPDQPIGTHVFTAMAATDDGKAMRWTVMSIPSSYRHPRRHAERRHRHAEDDDTDAAKPAAVSAVEALDRITLPPEAVKRISALLIPGSSLIVSDNALSDETDNSTSFIVLTR